MTNTKIVPIENTINAINDVCLLHIATSLSVVGETDVNYRPLFDPVSGTTLFIHRQPVCSNRAAIPAWQQTTIVITLDVEPCTEAVCVWKRLPGKITARRLPALKRSCGLQVLETY